MIYFIHLVVYWLDMRQRICGGLSHFEGKSVIFYASGDILVVDIQILGSGFEYCAEMGGWRIVFVVI